MIITPPSSVLRVRVVVEERGIGKMSQSPRSMADSLGKKKRKNRANNKFRESASIFQEGRGTADADGADAAEVVRNEAPAQKQDKAGLHKRHAPAAAAALAPRGQEGGQEAEGGSSAKQAVKRAGVGVASVQREGLVKIKLDYPYPHTWVFEQQPKRTAYGGIGFAKPSTWLPIPADRNSVEYSDFIDKFEEVYNEHIEYGSTGKAFIKGFKREREANMLWRVKLREKIEEDGGGKKKKKGKKSKEGRGTGGEVAEGGDGGGGAEGEVMHGATLSRSDMMKERVKKRRAVAKSQQSRSMPKVQVDENLQTSAIQAYRRMKEAKKAPSNIDRVQPGPGRQAMGGGGGGGSAAAVGGWGLLASRC